MKYIKLLLLIFVWFLTYSGTTVCKHRSLTKQLKYLFKAEVHCGEMGCSQRILIKQPPSSSLAESLTAVDDRTIMTRIHFTKEMRIQVLKELLTFQYDSVKSDKLLYIRGKWKNVEDKDFTIEEIYNIYRKWLVENEKTGFNNLKFPLADNPFDWLGAVEGSNKYLKQSL